MQRQRVRDRTRPCLLYQIKRCSAPCVGRIGGQDYAELVERGADFLVRARAEIQDAPRRAMQAASDALDFESAALSATASAR